MGFRFTWRDTNVSEDGHRIYRSTSPMDLNNLPPPLVELGPNIEIYEDGTVTPGLTYYYIFSAFVGGVEVFSDEYEFEAVELPTRIFYAHRFGSPTIYDEAIKNHFINLGYVFTFVPQGEVANTQLINTDVLFIGAPGDSFTLHPESGILTTLPCRIISMCRNTSYNSLSFGSSTASAGTFTGITFNASIDTDPVLSAFGYSQGQTLVLGPSLAGQRVQGAFEANELLAGFSNYLGDAGLAARVSPSGKRVYHLGYYRADVATPEFFKLLLDMTTLTDQY